MDEEPAGRRDVTRLIAQAGKGDERAAAELLPLVYEQLKRIAAARMAGERRGHTLQATALVHEAYARLVGNDGGGWSSNGQFLVAAAEAMRRILVEHARSRGRLKRGGVGRRRLSLDIADIADLAADDKTGEIVALDEALRRLQVQRPRVAQIVQLRFYAGLTVDQAAAALGVSPRTADLDWAFARAWLYHELSEGLATEEHADG